MPGYRKVHALLTTRFGSVDTCLPDGTPLPAGIAHFLEHQMFQTPEGDAFDVYAARGASANAYTTTTHTTYLFTCTRRFEENLDTLLETLLHVDAAEETVRREKGIIGQEIAMYDDDPAWRGYFGLLGALYRRHPARADIVGSRRSIRSIDVDLLQRTHDAFYAPANLLLVVAGDVDPAWILAHTEARLAGRGRRGRHRRKRVAEPRTVASGRARCALPLSRPQVHLGLKDRPSGGGRALVRRQVHSAMVMDLLCGDGGRIQAPLYDAGLVDDGFQGAYEAEVDYAHGIISAEVDAERPYRTMLLSALRRAARDGFSDEEVERARRKMFGRHLRTFNSPEGVGNWLLGVALDGAPWGAEVAAVEDATRPRLERRMRELIAAPRAWSVLVPKRRR
jgi:predicted Zn-dependent peptidase